MPVVACIGEAAGVAVGMAIKDKTDTRSINVPLLQEKLKSYGAYIGE